MPVYKPAIPELCRFTGLNRGFPTIRNLCKIKPQVDSVPFFEKCRYGRPAPI